MKNKSEIQQSSAPANLKYPLAGNDEILGGGKTKANSQEPKWHSVLAHI